MSLLKKFSNLFFSPTAKTDRAMYIYVQCNRCGEKMRARVDMWNELSPEYDGKSDSSLSYHCRKVLVGQKRCYQPIELTLEFDKNHKLVDKKIDGGKFIEEDEFNRQES